MLPEWFLASGSICSTHGTLIGAPHTVGQFRHHLRGGAQISGHLDLSTRCDAVLTIPSREIVFYKCDFSRWYIRNIWLSGMGSHTGAQSCAVCTKAPLWRLTTRMCGESFPTPVAKGLY